MNLLFFDVDGTLLELSRGITDVSRELKEAFSALRAKGDRFFISTGRSHGALPGSILALEPDGYSLCAGAFVTVDGREILNVHFPRHTLDFVMSRLDQFPTIQYLECGLDLYTNQYGTEPGRRFNQTFGIPDGNLKPLNGHQGLKVNKLSVTFQNMEDIEAMEDFSDHGLTVLVQPSPDSFDITLSHSTKRDGMKAVRKELDPENVSRVYAFGDNYNDLEMIEFADVGVAMGNGPRDLKAIADFVTLPVEEGGVLHALRELDLI